MPRHAKQRNKQAITKDLLSRHESPLPAIHADCSLSFRCFEGGPEGGLKVILYANAFQVLFSEIASRHLVRLYCDIPFHGRERTRNATSSIKHALLQLIIIIVKIIVYLTDKPAFFNVF